jgi:hypothetical protein
VAGVIPSLASIAPVGANLLSARQLLGSFVFIARLQFSSVESSASCWRSQPFGRSRSSRVEAVGTPGMLAGILLGPWCAPLVIPMTLAPETGKVSWAIMGLRRVPLLAEVLLAIVEVPGFLVWLGRSSPRGYVLQCSSGHLGTSRFQTRPGWRPRAGVLPHWNSCRFGSCSHAAARIARQ